MTKRRKRAEFGPALRLVGYVLQFLVNFDVAELLEKRNRLA